MPLFPIRLDDAVMEAEEARAADSPASYHFMFAEPSTENSDEQQDSA